MKLPDIRSLLLILQAFSPACSLADSYAMIITNLSGGVTKLCSGDLAVRIFGYRGQKLQQIAEKIKMLWTKY